MSIGLTVREAGVVRPLLTAGLYRLHRPELSEIIEQADFALDEHTLVVKLSAAHHATAEQAITTAALHAGLAIQDARYW